MKKMKEKKPQSLRGKFLSAIQFVKNPAADKTNPYFQSRYVSLAAILEELRRAQLVRDVAYAYRFADGILTSYIFDENEKEDLSSLPVDVDSNPQVTGSRLTYAKRQLAQLDWAICADDDDDGNAAADIDEKKEAAETLGGSVELVCQNCGKRFSFAKREDALKWYKKTRGEHLDPKGKRCESSQIVTA